MTSTEAALQRLAELVEQNAGFQVPTGHLTYLGAAVRTRAQVLGLPSVESYVEVLEHGRLAGEWRALLPLITVKESSFFRTPEHFAAVSRNVIPDLVQRRSSSRQLRIWSAGCARGEEPWTLAMVLAQASELAGWDWWVVATDVDEDALAKAEAASYGDRAVRSLPGNLRETFLQRGPSGYEVVRSLRPRVRFVRQNLVRDPPPAAEFPFDLILLRNVLIYFAPEVQRRVLARIERALAPDGFLFVGPSETLWPLTRTLVPRDLGDCFCYQRAAHSGGPADPRESSGGSASAHPGSPRPKSRLQPSQVSPAGRPFPAFRASPDGFVSGFQGSLSSSSSWSAETTARSLSAGDVAGAAVALSRAREDQPENPEIHALEGLVHDLAGRIPQAQASYRAALYLEPQLFQVRLLLARTMHREGRRDRATAEYRQVLATLAAGRGRVLASLDALEQPGADEAQQFSLDALRTLV